MTSRLLPRATYGVPVIVRLPCPLPRLTSHGPVDGPNGALSDSGSAAASSLTVVMPTSASRFDSLRPMPHRASVGWSPRTSNQVS